MTVETQTSKTILVADDDFAYRLALSRFLMGNGYKVIEAIDGTEALQLAEENLPDLVVSDDRMPGVTGQSLLENLRNKGNHVPFVLISGYFSSELPQIPADAILAKPFIFSKLNKELNRLLHS
jgi:CheY-like chemotaxis protein